MSDLIYLKGTPEQLKSIIMQIMATHQLHENLDIYYPPINDDFDPGRRYCPLVRLYFRQDSDFVAGTNQPKGRGRNRKEGELRFRLMNETTETISEGELTSLGQRIKQAFGGDNGYIWHKGKELFTYADWSRGYQLQMLVRTEAQARELTTKILALQGHTPIWKYLTKSQNVSEAERYPAVAETKIILGKQVTLPLRRPNVEVRFKYADVQISPLIDPIVIYDRTGKKKGALVR